MRALLCLVAIFSAGCTYLGQRGLDFSDCFKVKAGIGIGAHSHVQLGPVALGLGAWVGGSAGWNGKNGAKFLGEIFGGFPIYTLYTGKFALETNLSVEDLTDRRAYWENRVFSPILQSGSNHEFSEDFVKSPDSTPKVAASSPVPIQEYFWLEASIQVIVGVQVGFNIAEFADFIVGWFGWDLLADDKR